MTDQEQAQVIRPDHPCRTPHAERIAAEGIRFERAYTTTAHCCPSRATFMTGLWPSRHGVYNNVLNTTAIHSGLREGVITFDQLLARAGYRMLFAGKWHVSGVENPRDRAWEELFVTAGVGVHHGRTYAQWREQAQRPEPTKRKRGWLLRPGWGPYRLYGTTPPRPETDPYHPGDLRVVRTAVERLRQLRESDRPWCLFVGTVGPHDPYTVPEHYATMYDPKEVPLPSNYHDTLEDKPHVYQRQRQFWDQLTEDEVRESIAHYWGFCTMQDDLFGMVLEALEETDQVEDTLVVFLSDHGDYVGAHGLYLKGVAPFDEAYHIPCVVRWPRGIVAPGRTVDEFITLADFAPTFLELAGVEPPEELGGQSLVPFFQNPGPYAQNGPPFPWRDALYTQFNGVEVYYTQRVVQTKRWKYVYNAFDFDELYDLERDPDEMRNLIGLPEYRPIVQELCTRMWRFAAEQEDIIHNPYPTTALAPFGPMVAFREEDTP